jgi:CheY-like chemotaxis protein
VAFARSPEEIRAELTRERPALAIVDLTTPGWDHGGLLDTLADARPAVPVLGVTTHVLARQTQPLHARCDRVVTRETLTRDLGRILQEGIAA